jgi:ATP-dependent Clp protease ATP-binding subunit ClpB
LDDIIIFNPLTSDEIAEITKLQIDVLAARLKLKGLTLLVTPEAVKAISESGYDPVYGARPLKRVIQRALENRIAKGVLAAEFADGDTVMVSLQGDEFVFRSVRHEQVQEGDATP